MDAEIAEAAALDAYSRVVVDVAERLQPSVANLRVERRGRRGRIEGGGSAIALSADGLLLTCAHVVGGTATGGRATLIDGRELGFDVVGRDRLTDLAVLRADGPGLAPATLGDAGGLRVGQLVVAIADVDPAGPAAAAGMRPDDVIVAIAGESVAGMDDLLRVLGPDAIGARMPVRLVRRGR